MLRDTRANSNAKTSQVRTVGFCNVDPAKIANPAQALPAGEGASLMLSLECPEAIAGALSGEVDVLVVDADQIEVSGLTALSFLQRERPEVGIFLYVEDAAGRTARLVPWGSIY